MVDCTNNLLKYWKMEKLDGLYEIPIKSMKRMTGSLFMSLPFIILFELTKVRSNDNKDYYLNHDVKKSLW